MEQNSVFGVLIEVPNAEVYAITKNGTQLLDRGSLKLAQNKEYKLTFLVINNFKYSLSKEIPVVGTYDKGYPIYALPNLEGKYGVVLRGPNDQEMINGLEMYLQNACAFKRAEGALHPVAHPPHPGQGALPESATTTDKVRTYLAQGGEVVKEGLFAAASFIAKGIAAGGDYIKDKIDHKEEVKVDDKVKTGLKTAGTVSNVALVYTKTQVQSLIKTGEVIAKDLGDSWEKSETGKKWEADENFQTAKKVGKTTAYALACVYEGLVDGAAVLGNALGAATANVLEKRYGKEVGDATRDGVDAVGNVTNVTRVFKNEGVAYIKQEADPRKDGLRALN